MIRDPLTVVFWLFVFTQVFYLLINVFVAGLLYARRVNRVPEEPPTTERPIHVLMAIRKERQEIVEETIREIYAQEYPSELINVYVVHESDDDVVSAYVDDLEAEAAERGWTVEP